MKTQNPTEYAARVAALEAEGMTTSDAQGVVDAENAKAATLRSFRIDTGDSGEGVAGFVAYVKARDESHALQILRERLRVDEYQVEDDEDFTVLVYLNAANVKIEEVEEEETE